jgi:hypothetical protein
LKYFESKESKSHVNISIYFLFFIFFGNVIENISREHVNNSQNILSSNIIHQNIDVQLQKREKNVFFFPSMDGKINNCHKNVFQYKEDIKDIVKQHVCYCIKTIY